MGTPFSLRAASAATLLSLAGCASLAPPFVAPAAPLPASYAEADGPGLTASSTGWQDYFSDPRLRQLIGQALAHNHDLRLAVLRVDEARAALGIEHAASLPTVGVGADASRSRVPADLNLSGQPVVAGQYQAGLAVSAWELDFWGRVRSSQDAAQASVLASEAARRAVALALVAQVADGYLLLREVDERVALAGRTLATRQEAQRIFLRRYQVGAISKLELMQVETLLTQAQSLLAQLEQLRAARGHALVQLCGLPDWSALAGQRAGPFDDAAVLAPLAAGLPSALLTSRPDLLAAEQQLRAAHARIGVARAAFFPSITLTASAGTASAELDGLFAAGSGAWTLAPRLNLPLFDSGRNRNSLQLAEVRREAAVVSYEKSIQTAFREVADGLSARRWLGRQVAAEQQALAAQSERARLATLRYQAGAAPYLEVLDAQRDLLNTEQQLVQTRRALLSSQVYLYAALGGGTLPAAPAPSF